MAYGLGGLLLLAIAWYVLKPLVVGIARGLAGLITGKADATENTTETKSDDSI